MNIRLSSKSFFAIASTVVLVLMASLFYFRVSYDKYLIDTNLNERATSVSQRVSKAVTPAVWNLFQRSTERYFSESTASAILDAELAADFVTGIKIYGNFGHLFTGRFKNNQGAIESYSDGDIATELQSKSSSLKYSVTMNGMTIGTVEVFYYDPYYQQKIYQSYVSEARDLGFITIILLVAIFYLHRANRQKLHTTEALNNLQSAQDRLVESEKLASLGSLVAGVAHEINTPLGIGITSTSLVLGNTKTLREKVDTGTLKKADLDNFIAQTQETLDISEKGLNRVVDLINTFKQVATDHEVEDVREIALVEYIEEVMKTMSSHINKKRVSYRIDADNDLQIVTIPGAVAQLVTNLVNNSLLHGFEGKESGNITMKVSNTEDKSIEFIYSDDGVGMSADVQRRIFEPFFTTRRNSGGTGLGMNIVYNLINKKLQGLIALHSEPEKGTTYTIILPKQLTKTKSKNLHVTSSSQVPD